MLASREYSQRRPAGPATTRPQLLAEAIGDARPWRAQRVLSHVPWDEEAARDLCREHVV